MCDSRFYLTKGGCNSVLLRWPRETMPANAWYMEQTSAGEEEDLDALIRAPCSESGSEGGGEIHWPMH